jgi:hypothetical protein
MVDEQYDDTATNGTETVPGAVVPSPPRRSEVSQPSSGAADGEVPALPEQHLELIERGARDVHVGSLSIQQGGVTNAWADTIDVKRGGITRAEARDISVVQGGVAVARADRISVGMGAVGLALGGQVDVNRGFARSVIARDVRIQQAGARTVIASKATFDRSSGALVVIAAKAEGNVRTLVDWRGAAALGAALGIVVGLFRLIRR